MGVAGSVIELFKRGPGAWLMLPSTPQVASLTILMQPQATTHRHSKSLWIKFDD